MADFLAEQGALILTGIFLTFISGFCYTINAYGFVSRGKYRKKEEAMIIFLGSTIFLGLITPLIHEVSKVTLNYVPIISIFGFIIVATNFTLHYSIPRWNHKSTKTILIYLGGFFLLVLGFLVNMYA